MTLVFFFSGVSWGKMQIKTTREFKKVINYLNYRKPSINCEKINLINLSINKDEHNFGILKVYNCGNGNLCP